MSDDQRFHVVVMVLLLACVVPAHGHHSFAQSYFESESVTIDGDVVEFQYRAPHAWLYVTVVDEQGRAQRYGAEWASPARLERMGVARETFQAGDRVSITGAPGRDASARQVHVKKVKRLTRGEWTWDGPQRRR
jgi:hypothetical protein